MDSQSYYNWSGICALCWNVKDIDIEFDGFFLFVAGNQEDIKMRLSVRRAGMGLQQSSQQNEGKMTYCLKHICAISIS